MNRTLKPKFNFHNAKPLAVRLGGRPNGEGYYTLSRAQERRIRAHFCGVVGCRCNSGGIETGPDGAGMIHESKLMGEGH